MGRERAGAGDGMLEPMPLTVATMTIRGENDDDNGSGGTGDASQIEELQQQEQQQGQNRMKEDGDGRVDGEDGRRESAPASAGPTTPASSSGEFYGCKHYSRRVKIVAPCCGEVFWCRHCHNDKYEKHMDIKYATIRPRCPFRFDA